MYGPESRARARHNQNFFRNFLVIFNRCREGEVASMPLSPFTRDTSDPHEDVNWALSEVEKKPMQASQGLKSGKNVAARFQFFTKHFSQNALCVRTACSAEGGLWCSERQLLYVCKKLWHIFEVQTASLALQKRSAPSHWHWQDWESMPQLFKLWWTWRTQKWTSWPTF